MVRELLDEAVPALQGLLEAHRVLKTRPEQAQQAMARLANAAIRDITQAQLDLDTAMQKRPGRKPGNAQGRGAANTG